MLMVSYEINFAGYSEYLYRVPGSIVHRRLIPGGPDAVIETSGTSRGIRAAVEMVRRTGRIVNIGLSGGLETPIKFDELVWKSVSLISGLGQAGNAKEIK